jgi:putative ABC transport system substrate-binding protein
MRRRDVIALLGSAGIWPLSARAQPRGVRRIGVLMDAPESDLEYQGFLTALRERLRRLGWAEDRNISMDIRWGAGSAEPIQQSAKELVRLQPDLLLSANTPTTVALLEQTHAIPIVFVNVSDPIGSGFVASFPRPGGNVTGFTNIEPTMAGKWLELLKEIAPRVERAAFLFNPATAPYAEFYMEPFKAGAETLRIKAVAAPVRDSAELEIAFAELAREPNGGLVVMTGSYTFVHRNEITALTARYRLPAIYPYRQFVEAGGLLSYGTDVADNYGRAAIYVDRILKGIKPSELPVQAPVKFELVVNGKTAKALGLEIPSSFYWRADEVIE